MANVRVNPDGFSIRRVMNAGVSRVVSMLTGGDALANAKDPDHLNVDELMRAAYKNALPVLFGNHGAKVSKGGRPCTTPDFTVRNVIKTFRKNIFPSGTMWQVKDDPEGKLTTEITALLEKLRWKQKLNFVVEEASLLGYCGIRTVYDDDRKQWFLDVIRKEQLEITRDAAHNSEIEAVSITWEAVDATTGKHYLHKERWTKDERHEWPRIEIGTLGTPKFKESDKITEPNTYKEIPVTIIPHQYDPWHIGRGALRHDDILAAKNLIELRDKRYRAHLQWMRPPLVRKNHESIGEEVCLDPDTVIDIRTGEGEGDADLFLLESQGVPESAIQEIDEWRDSIFKNAGLTPPSQRDNFAAGGVVKSGVALEVLTEEEEETITDLRDDGYTEVTRHVEKIVRMALALQGDAASPFVGFAGFVEAQDSFISVVFPPLSTPTNAEVSETISMLRDSHLSAEEKAKREAQILGITDEAEIGEIQANWEEAAKLLEPTRPPLNGFASDGVQ